MNIRPRVPWLNRNLYLSPPFHLYTKLSPPRRSFQTSRPNHLLGETTLQYTQQTFEYIHTYSDLPWGLSIPLTAILLRSIISLPTYYAAFHNQRKMKMAHPLQEAYRNALSIQETEGKGVKAKKTFLSRFRTAKVGGQSEVWILFSWRFKSSRYIGMLPLLYVPVWLESIDALRQMSAAGKLSSSFASATTATPGDFSSLTSEGFWWFSDLTALDSYLWGLYATLRITQALVGMSESFTLSRISATAPTWPRLKTVIYKLPAAVGAWLVATLLSPSMPAAAALFCLSSSLYASLTRSLMRRMMRGVHRPIIQPARGRKVQMRKKLKTAGRHGLAQYASSKSVPKEFDERFLEIQRRASRLDVVPPTPHRKR